jgi:hypothetical protein
VYARWHPLAEPAAHIAAKSRRMTVAVPFWRRRDKVCDSLFGMERNSEPMPAEFGTLRAQTAAGQARAVVGQPSKPI